MGTVITDCRIEEYTAKLRRELVANKDLATRISDVLAQYELAVPDGMMVVWGPTVIAEARSAFDMYRIWEVGIPAPQLLRACYGFEDKFRL